MADSSPPSTLDTESKGASATLEEVTSQVEEYPTGLKLYLLLLSIYLSIFLIALDRTIIATALPVITDHFHSIDDIGWYNAAFTLPGTAFQLFFGRCYTFYSPKWVFLALIFTFEVGTALCGAAPSSVAFIWGRAIAGLGAGGLFNGSMILMMYAAPLSARPMYMGFLGAFFAVASVAGPLAGGVFTTKLSWRWAFYMNLPIGACVLVFLYFFVDNNKAALGDLPLKEKLSRLDIPGTLVFIPCIVCILLALQWGGTTYAWSDGRIITLFVLFGVLLIVFAGIQIWQKESATIPLRIAKNRTIIAGIFYSFCLGSSFMIAIYYLSIWFQAVKGDSAIRSGYATLPFVLGLVVGSIVSGIIVNKTSYYNPCIITAAVFASIGSSLLTLFKTTTAHPMWIGIQVQYGFGIGLGLQLSSIAAQTVLDKRDAPTGISVVFFGQGLGGAISVAMAETILNTKLISGLSRIGNISPEEVVYSGATNLRTLFHAKQLRKVLEVYNNSLVNVFYAATAFACASTFAAVAMEWRSTKSQDKAAEKIETKVEDSEVE